MEKKYKYPSRYEIEQALGEFSTRSFLDKFAQSRGIFITKVVRSELAEIISGLFLEHRDLEQIREAAFRIHSRTTLAGFNVHSHEQQFNLVAFFDELRNKDLNDDMKISPIVADHQNDQKIYKGNIEYVQRKPGRVEFLQEDKRSFDFFIYELEQGEWQVLVDCNKSNDSKVLEDVVKRNTRREVRLDIIDQDLLTSQHTIKFFDELATRGVNENWKLNEVKQLIFRKAIDDEEKEVEKSELAGITQAILEGNDLRENPFVKQSEESGYRFTAMTYEYEHLDEPFVMQIHAEFKGRPKVFEIGLKSFKSREGIDEKYEYYNLSQSDEMKIRTTFWEKAKEIYDELMFNK